MTFLGVHSDIVNVPSYGVPLHLAIGIFDGVHLGHQALLQAAIRAARNQNGIAGVLTFDPHPSRIVRPHEPTLLMMPLEAKFSFLQKLGIDFIIQQHFDSVFAKLTPKDFVRHLKKNLTTLTSIYVGANFRFGCDRSGDLHLLVEESRRHGITTFSVERIRYNDEPISSSLIREKLTAGQIEEANKLLGYPYRSEGICQQGAQVGRTLGFPTINFAYEPELKPRYGVYGVAAYSGASTVPRYGVANYGLRPTMGLKTAPLLELHLFSPPPCHQDFCKSNIITEWHFFVRPEYKFESIDALVQQMNKDKRYAWEFWKRKLCLEGAPHSL